MMINLARIADRGPLVAGALAATLLLGALWIPVLLVSGLSGGAVLMASFASMYFLICSAAVVAFVALRHGEIAAFKVVGGCLLAVNRVVGSALSVGGSCAVNCFGILVACDFGSRCSD